MDDSQAQEPETAASSSESTSLGERVREVREHLERASAALAALDQLLPASTQPVDEHEDQPGGQASGQADERSQS
ncbi:hypothetical protein [Nocardioides sp.]|uniref:hypothetical protein n=1 Tax=Nocardioides sp. TaxID=35761 RepID=UPI00321B92D0